MGPGLRRGDTVGGRDCAFFPSPLREKVPRSDTEFAKANFGWDEGSLSKLLAWASAAPLTLSFLLNAEMPSLSLKGRGELGRPLGHQIDLH